MSVDFSLRRIALYGRSGSGKTSVAEYIAKKHGLVICSTGAHCREITRRLFDTENRRTMNELSERIREIDPHIWIKAALKGAGGDSIVLESIRFRSDVDFLRPKGFEIWHIKCPVEICTERLRDRGQDFDGSDMDHPMEGSLSSFEFDIVIENGDDSTAALYEKIDLAIAKK